MSCQYLEYKEESYKGGLFGNKTKYHKVCYCKAAKIGPIEDRFGINEDRARICRDTGYKVTYISGTGTTSHNSKYYLDMCMHLPAAARKRLSDSHLNTGYLGGKITEIRIL